MFVNKTADARNCKEMKVTVFFGRTKKKIMFILSLFSGYDL